MEAELQGIAALVVTGTLVPFIIYGIKWLRKVINKTEFGRKLQIDDTLFEVAEDTAKTILPDLMNAATKWDKVSRDKALKQVAIRMRAHGVNIWQTHGRDGVEELLDQALAAAKIEAKITSG